MNTKDLFVLVADKNMRFAFEAGLGRPQALGTGPFTFEIKNQPGFDGAMRTAGARTLSLLANQYTHALMVLDFEGSGADRPAVELEELLDQDLSYHWQSRAKSIVIEPELVELAQENARRNGLGDRVQFVQGDVAAPAAELEARGLVPASFDVVVSNPPYLDPQTSRASPFPLQARASSMAEAGLDRWGR